MPADRYLLCSSFWVRSVQNHRPFSKRLLDPRKPSLSSPHAGWQWSRSEEPAPYPVARGRPGHCAQGGSRRRERGCRSSSGGSFYLKFSLSVDYKRVAFLSRLSPAPLCT